MFGCQFIFSCLFLVAVHVSLSLGDELSQKEKDQIEWDDQLVSKADQWAQGCDWSHNQDKSRTLGTVGENIAINQDPIHGGIKHWESEKRDWTYGNCDAGCTGGACRHYTQMIWAATTKIGCGVATCSQFTSSDGDDMSGFDRYKYLVCNYYQAGNFPGEPPYKTGTGTGEGTNKGGETEFESFY